MKVPTGGEIGAAAAVALSYLVVRSGRLEETERRVARVRRVGGPHVDRGMAHLTDLGSVYGLAGTVAALAAGGRRRLAGDVLGGGTIAWIAGQAAKPLLNRPRPFESGTPRLVATPSGTSWPSGHSAVAAAIGASVAGESTSAAATAAVLATFVGGSRLHVGVHHPTDVIAGWGVGVLSVGLWRRLRERVSRR